MPLRVDVRLQDKERVHGLLLQLMEIRNASRGNLLYTAQGGGDLSSWLQDFVEGGGDFNELSVSDYKGNHE
jgi:hypothetical protein